MSSPKLALFYKDFRFIAEALLPPVHQAFRCDEASGEVGVVGVIEAGIQVTNRQIGIETRFQNDLIASW
jgi:hypothetical protein